MAVLTQELLLHAERCMRHEDVSKKIMLTGLNRTLDEWLCDSFVELIEEMELWKKDDATEDFWSRLAKALQLSNISITWAEQSNSRLASVIPLDNDDNCFYYQSWRNNVVIAFENLSSFLI